ncbi:ephrin RBD domain-containing protein [Caerostris extrusa]|uniref:Ephrin RBD domain-containing protein n=1 Tax=Caerostris extrusa TaxID=172846 RepID=A0AAV4PV70_CAEEX|nr:ephrin RBD domain-containing protein [Caerostris extrusa]
MRRNNSEKLLTISRTILIHRNIPYEILLSNKPSVALNFPRFVISSSRRCEKISPSESHIPNRDRGSFTPQLPMFRIDNTDHIIDVNKGNIPFEYDQVNIICPVYNPGTKEEDVERYIIYNVSKEEYDSCRITNPASRKIALCDKPHQLMYFTITFRSFTPQPGGLEFRPGQDYYFISTSAGGEGQQALEQKIGGRCATHNMKVIFKVCCGPTKSTTKTLPSSSTTTSVATTTTATVMPEKTTFIYRFNRPTNPPFRPPPPSIYTSKYPPIKSYDFPREEEHGKVPNKKTEDRDKLPNETRAKNEELVKSAANIVRVQQNCVTTVALLLLFIYQLLSR